MPRWCRRRRCRVLDEQPWRDSSPGFANRAVPMYERYPRFEWHWRNACGAKWHRIPGSPIDTGSRSKFPCADHVSSRSSLWPERADRPVKGDSDWRIRRDDYGANEPIPYRGQSRSSGEFHRHGSRRSQLPLIRLHRLPQSALELNPRNR